MQKETKGVVFPPTICQVVMAKYFGINNYFQSEYSPFYDNQTKLNHLKGGQINEFKRNHDVLEFATLGELFEAYLNAQRQTSIVPIQLYIYFHCGQVKTFYLSKFPLNTFDFTTYLISKK